MQRLKVKLIYKSLDLFVKLSILIKKIFRISPYICCFSYLFILNIFLCFYGNVLNVKVNFHGIKQL